MNKIVLGTSISPKNIEKQKYAIKTWVANGFKVVSCNTNEEIQLLTPHFQDVEIDFVKIDKTAERLIGKPLPYMKDILETVGGMTESVCGYSNSDIVMPILEKDMYSFIHDEAKESLIITHRYGIDNYSDIDDVNWQIHIDGIDLFFIDKKCAGKLFDYEFSVQTTWDLCLPSKCKKLGIKIKELVNPIAFHLKHSIQWNSRAYTEPLNEFSKINWGKCNNVYERVFDEYYSILYNMCEPICYLREEASFLFVVEKQEEQILSTIKAQKYTNIVIESSDENKKDYDFVVYMKPDVLLNKEFCKSIIYLMKTYRCSELRLGRFLISQIDDVIRYNNVSRNICILEEINQLYDLEIKVVQNNQLEEKSRNVLIPLISELIDMNDNSIVDRYMLSENTYIMPSGMRAYERYQIYKNKLNRNVIRGFIDNNEAKWGEKQDDLLISPLNDVLKIEETCSIIIASKFYSVEIQKQLSNIGNKLNVYNDSLILYMDEAGLLYYLNLEKYGSTKI